MLNRRILRGKVMQQIFAYKTCVAANAEITHENIIENFTPNLNANEVQDAKLLEGYAKLSLTLFDAYLKTGVQDSFENTPQVVAAYTAQSIAFYNQSNAQDKQRILSKMLSDCELLLHYYLLILDLPCRLAAKWKEIKKSTVFENNYFVQILSNDASFISARDKRNLTWANDEDIISQLFTEWQNDAMFKQYQKAATHTIEQDKELILHLIKNVVFKSASIHDFFEAKNLHWSEDKVAVKDMCLDTVKMFAPNSPMELARISKNWDDDKHFVTTLFNMCLEHDQYFEELIIPKLKNWDISRLTATDSIIMKMCLCEMLHFSTIPVKVSLNEYIEVAKRYSTPKSKTLINGVLDNLTSELVGNGKIKKSGRGLLDNK